MKIFNIIKINDKIEPYIIDNGLGCFSKSNTFENVLKDVCQNIYDQSKCVGECFILSFNCKNDICYL